MMQRANKFRFHIAWLVLLTSELAENEVERWPGPIYHQGSTMGLSKTKRDLANDQGCRRNIVE